ncbi:MAG: hypothetical protein JWO58_674 [Chitinophagaceae bacterium]|nr:hypothetical protein [Chitinophagaceae bacterium]
MIELLSREEALACNKTLASYIVDLQNLLYNPSLSGNLLEPGEIYSQEECDESNKEMTEAYEKKKDQVSVIPIKENFKGRIIYTFSEKEVNRYLNHLASTFAILADKLQWRSVIFLLDYSTPWLSQKNDCEPVQKALDYLTRLGVNEDFTGGFKVNGNDLKEFIQQLFWIIRCNAALPYCFFSGENSAFVGSICKQGNFHFEFYSEEEKMKLEKTAKDIGMIDTKVCDDILSNNGSIEGRQIIV